MPDAKELRKIYNNARDFALRDDRIDWPSQKFDNPVDAIIDALDNAHYVNAKELLERMGVRIDKGTEEVISPS